MFSLFFLLLGALQVYSLETDLKIPTSSGIVLGKKIKTLDESLRLFLGVPYALPPTNNLRFKPPVPLRAETIVRDATRFGPSCYQPPHLASVISPLLHPNRADIDEDCLFLNIYVPEGKGLEQYLPVVVFLPGEGFDYADPQQFDGSYLAVQGNVIVVTVNYRLSAFGFLSTLSEEAPGNVGLLDQRLALEWIKENIINFGGNPDAVTLIGRFTGAMSAAIHAFSPLNKETPLFKNIILQSGIPVGDWAFNRRPLDLTYDLASKTNCLFSQVSDVIFCLRHLPADILLNAALSLPSKWRPIIDYSLIFEDTLNAVANLKDSNLNIMVGINTNEGTLCTMALNAMQSPLYEKILNNTLSADDFDNLVDRNLFNFFGDRDTFINTLTSYKYKNPKKSLRDSVIEFCSDFLIVSHVQKFANEAAKKNINLYFYEFAHRPTFSISPPFIEAAHGDDVLYTMGLPFQVPDLPSDERRLTIKMVERISNFARSGNPNGEEEAQTWPKYTAMNPEVIVISTSRDRNIKRLDEDSSIYWHSIVPAAQHRPCFQPSLSSSPRVFNQVDSLTSDSFTNDSSTSDSYNYFSFSLLAVIIVISIITVSLLINILRKFAYVRMY